MSGDDSPLATPWEEIKEQLQHGLTPDWPAYLDTMRQFVAGFVLELTDDDRTELMTTLRCTSPDRLQTKLLQRLVARGKREKVKYAPFDFEYFSYPLRDFTVYAQVLERTGLERSRVRAFSCAAPFGEVGDIDTSRIENILSFEQFKLARDRGWPTDLATESSDVGQTPDAARRDGALAFGAARIDSVPAFSTLPLRCWHCGAAFTFTIAGWTPQAPVKSRYTCPTCSKFIEFELPGRAIWHLPLDDAQAVRRLRLLECGDRSRTIILRNLMNAGRAYAAAEAVAAKVKAWQANGMVHPLTCGQNSTHRKLVPVATTSGVLLCCGDCDYQQRKIPAFVTWERPGRSGEVSPWADGCSACGACVILMLETFTEEAFRLGLIPTSQDWTCPKCEAQHSQGLPGTIQSVEKWSSGRT